MCSFREPIGVMGTLSWRTGALVDGARPRDRWRLILCCWQPDGCSRLAESIQALCSDPREAAFSTVTFIVRAERDPDARTEVRHGEEAFDRTAPAPALAPPQKVSVRDLTGYGTQWLCQKARTRFFHLDANGGDGAP